MTVPGILARVGVGLALLLLVALALFRTVGRPLTTRLLGEARVHAPEVAPGEPIHATFGVAGALIPRRERLEGLSGDLIRHYASLPFPDWGEQSKVHAPRVLFAKLTAGVDVAAVNEYLLAAEPTAPSGSSWELRPVADYDFTEIILAAILMEFSDQPQILWPRTQDHLVDTLLIETGYRIRWTVPGSLGAVQETENHILMTEVSRYLRNVWLSRNRQTSSRHTRRTDRHALELTGFFTELESAGLYEFNSQPYGGYTMAAAFVAFSYAPDGELRDAARKLIDRQAFQFAIGSHGLRRVVAFRRQLGRAERTSLFEDPLSAIASVWAGSQPGPGSVEDIRNQHHAVVAALTGYRPGEAVMEALRSSGGERLVAIGRGPGSSPEIHSIGPGFHLSAGGAGDAASGIAARPTLLLLDDGATDRSGLFRIRGTGRFTGWNNTGVHRRLAVGPQPAEVPADAVPALSAGPLELFLRGGVGIVVVRMAGVGLIHVVEGEPFSEFERIVENNDVSTIGSFFVTADGSRYDYQVDAPAGTWVFASPEIEPLVRSYSDWPRLKIVKF